MTVNAVHIIDVKNTNNEHAPNNERDDEINQADEKTSLLRKKTLEEKPASNADFTLTPVRTAVYCGIDIVGGARQVSSTVENSSKIAVEVASKLGQASHVSQIASVGTPIGLLITGPLCMATAAAWTIPDAAAALKTAKNELKKCKQDVELTAEGIKILEDAKQAVKLAELGVANHSLYFTMGASQTASGVVGMLGQQTAHLLHYAPVLTGSVAGTAAMATSVALGAVYVARGSVMLVRGYKGHGMAKQFHEELENSSKPLVNDPVESAIQFMKDAEKLGDGYLGRRMDSSLLQVKNEKGEVVGKYTAEGIKGKDGKISSHYVTKEQKVDYLKRVDKAIYTKKLEYKISMVIAGAMILGGILAIISACVFTGGIALLVIGLASAIFFMSMEYIFLTYDSSSLFEKLRNKLYSEPEWVKALSTVKEGINQEKT
jgi:hypothetical protein